MITCRGWSETKNWIFYENVPLNLENQILSDAFNDVDTKCDLLLNIATFIKNFHDKGWVHGDIVTMNVQLINNYTPRIIDFGWSGPITPEKSVNEDFKKFKRLIMQLLLNISYNEIVVMQVDLPEYSVKLGFNNLMNAKNLDQIVDEIKLLCQYYKSTDKWKIEKKNMMKKNGGTIRYNEIVEEEDE
jgi:tRNA A-37 threonylcarbamoyl transferase component Bud32